MHPARSRVLRRWFFVSLLLAIAVILLSRFLVFPDADSLPDWRRTAATVLDNLLAAAVTSLTIGTAYILLFPEPEREQVEIVQARAIHEIIEGAARSCATWDVRARTASYFARVTLPLLRDCAFRTGGSVKVRVQLLDPNADDTLAMYARFRSNRPGASAVWTSSRVREEIYSTALAAAIFTNEAPRLEVELGFSPDFWVLSLDMNEEVALVTGQNKGDPALFIRRTSPLFPGWRDDFEAGFQVCRVVKPRITGIGMAEIKDPDAKTYACANSFFEGIGLKRLEEEQLRNVLNFTKRNHNYA